jgi:hypothetical protein
MPDLVLPTQFDREAQRCRLQYSTIPMSGSSSATLRGTTAQLNPTSDTDTAAAIDSGA